MPGRDFSSEKYRFGFNGKENDNEVKGIGKQQDYGLRIYDPRISRFLSIDPLSEIYPDLSTYQYASNSPVAAKDIDGAEADAKFDGIERNDKRAAEILHPGNKAKQQQYIRENQKARGYGALIGAAIILSCFTAPEVAALAYLNAARIAPIAASSTIVAGRYGPEAIAFATAALGYDGEIPGASGDNIAKGLRIGATKFYNKFSKYAVRGSDYIASHLKGIDFTKDVVTKTLHKGEQVIQFVDNKSGKLGDYYAPLNTDGNTLGIDLKNRTAKIITLTDDVEVLESVAADYTKDGITYKGGGTQYFSPDITNNQK